MSGVSGMRDTTAIAVSGPCPRAGRVRGFTLLELLVVMVIIGLLAGYVGPRYFSQIGKTERSTAKAQIEGLAKALDTYRLDVGHYPTTEQGLAALVTAPANESRWAGPYLQKGLPQDPWDRAYVYRQPAANPAHDFDLLSLGKDGQAGGEADAADVSYR
jgi:general secretion pathway protein G